MMMQQQLKKASGPRVASNGSPAARISNPVRPMATAASTPTAPASTWDYWKSIQARHPSSKVAGKGVEGDYKKELAASVVAAASSFTPKLSVTDVASTFKWSHHTPAAASQALPSDLRARLEVVGIAGIKSVLQMSPSMELDVATVSMTTSEVEAGVSATGIIIQKGSDRTAVIALVATETSRLASWSRLEGLLLHWAVSEGAGATWNSPPAGWSAAPAKGRDAGGAWENSFDKVNSNDSAEPLYSIVLQLPLRGPLKSNGGITFVLKATSGQNTRWMKDAGTQKDFFVDLHRLPIIKA